MTSANSICKFCAEDYSTHERRCRHADWDEQTKMILRCANTRITGKTFCAQHMREEKKPHEDRLQPTP